MHASPPYTPWGHSLLIAGYIILHVDTYIQNTTSKIGIACSTSQQISPLSVAAQDLLSGSYFWLVWVANDAVNINYITVHTWCHYGDIPTLDYTHLRLIEEVEWNNLIGSQNWPPPGQRDGASSSVANIDTHSLFLYNVKNSWERVTLLVSHCHTQNCHHLDAFIYITQADTNKILHLGAMATDNRTLKTESGKMRHLTTMYKRQTLTPVSLFTHTHSSVFIQHLGRNRYKYVCMNLT